MGAVRCSQVFTTAEVLREVRGAAGLSVRAMARLTHFSPSYLSMVEAGKRPASPEIVAAYEQVLGVGGLGEIVDRRGFLRVTALVAIRAPLVSDLAASIADGDVGPLAVVQTTHDVDLAVAAVADRPMAAKLSRWMLNGETAVVARVCGRLGDSETTFRRVTRFSEPARGGRTVRPRGRQPP